MTRSKRTRPALLVAAALGAAVIAIGTPMVLSGDPPATSGAASPSGSQTADPRAETKPAEPVDEQHGTSRRGTGPEADMNRFQAGAKAAAEGIASGDGLRVENKTGAPIILTFPDGATASVAPGSFMVMLNPCRDTLPLRAERENGELIGVRDGPCRARDAWTLTNG